MACFQLSSISGVFGYNATVLPPIEMQSPTDKPQETAGFTKEDPAQTSKPLKGRACENWRVIPGMLAVATCIFGIVLCILWRQQYLSITFGVGTTAALYMLYLAYQHRHLQSLEESSKIYRSENEKYKENNTTLASQLGEMKQQNDNLSSNVTNLNGAVTDLEKKNAQLQQRLDEIKAANADLDKLIKQLQTKTEREEAAMKAIISSIEGASEKVLKNHEEFNASVGGVSDKLKEIQEDLGSVKKAGDAFEKLLQQVNKLKDDKYFEQQARFIEMQEKQMQEKQRQIGELDGKISLLNEQNKKLAEHNQRLSHNIKRMEDTNNNLVQTAEILSKQVKDEDKGDRDHH